MGLLSFLKPALSIGLAPFTGGASLAGLAGDVGSILGGASKNQQNERILADQNNLRRDQLGLQRFQVNEGLPGDRLSTSVRASRVANASPVSLSYGDGGFNPQDAVAGKFGKFTGGYANPNLIDPRTKQQANAVLDQMLQKQMGGEMAPALSAPTKEGKGSKILGGLGFGLSLLGGLGGMRPHGGSSAGFEPNDMNGWG